MLADQLSKPEAFVEFANQNQTTIRRYPQSLEIDLQKPVET